MYPKVKTFQTMPASDIIYNFVEKNINEKPCMTVSIIHIVHTVVHKMLRIKLKRKKDENFIFRFVCVLYYMNALSIL